MKRMVFFVVLLISSTCCVYAASADEILAPAYGVFDNIPQGYHVSDINTKETAGKKITQKSRHFEAGQAVKQTGKSGDKTQPSGKALGLYPSCLFNLREFLKNYDLSVLQKDERIKLGREEIIAVRKGQKSAYPQIRIIVKDGKVVEMRFYSMRGKKYYEVKVEEYAESSGTTMPARVKETVFARDNTVTEEIKLQP